VKRLVLIGGGHSHVEVVRRLGLRPSVSLHVMLVSPQRFTPYSGMLPGLIAGHYDYLDCHIDLVGLCAASSVEWVQDAVVGLDPAQREFRLASGARVGYDLASIDIGSAPPPAPDAPADSQDIPVKPTETFLAWWDQVRIRAKRSRLRLLTVGGGAAGVEVTLAMQHRLRAEGVRASFSIATMEPCILASHSPRVRRCFEQVLRARGVGVLSGAKVVGVEAGIAQLDSGARVEADGLVWALGPKAASWPAAAGVATDEAGFVLVDRHLRSISHPDLFAAGDIATLRDRPHPKSGVYAVRHGPPLEENLRRTLSGERLLAYAPQRTALALISTGDKYAVASWGPLTARGAWVWHWKDRIDRKFMARYRVSSSATPGS